MENKSGENIGAKGDKTPKGFVLTMDAVFGLVILLVAMMLISSFLQTPKQDPYAGVRLSQFGYDFLTSVEKTGTMIVNNGSTINQNLTCNSTYNGNWKWNRTSTGYDFINASNMAIYLDSFQPSICANLQIDRINPLLAVVDSRSAIKSGCNVSGIEYVTVRRSLVLASSTFINETWRCNQSANTSKTWNYSITTNASYSFGVMNLTLWYKN